MDFTETEDQAALTEMVRAVLAGTGPSDPSTLDGFDEGLWKILCDNGVVAAALPESCGGDAVGIGPVASVLELLGRRAAITPYLATVVLGVLPLRAYGRADDDEYLRAAGDGAILTAALSEVGHPVPDAPGTTAVREGSDLAVTGRKVAVPYAADAVLMMVSTDVGVVAIPTDAVGVTITRTRSSSGSPESTVVLDRVRVPASALLGPNAVLADLARVGASAFADGLAAGALELTAGHLASRHQFGRPLATFQAVAQQIADAYVAARTIHLAAVSATWRLAEGLDATADVALAAYWVAAELPPMMQLCHHLHGGTGADVTYPMHRYFSLATDVARSVGGPAHTLDRLGARCSST